MYPDEEVAFLSAVSHYFLWKSAQEAVKEKQEAAQGIVAMNASTTAATQDATKKQEATTKSQEAQSSEKNAKEPTSTTPAPKDGDSKEPPAPETNSRSFKFTRLYDSMRKEFPELPPLPSDANAVYPILAARYSLFPQLHQEVSFLRTRNRELIAQNALRIPQATGPVSQATKRKDSPAAAPAVKSTGVATATASKKRRTNANTPVSKSMKIACREDVPEDIKQLVALVRQSAHKEKSKANRKIARLKEKVSKVEEQAKKPPPPKPAPVPAPAPRVQLPLKEPPPLPPPKTWDERFAELEYFKKGNGHCRVPTRQAGLGRWVVEMRSVYRTLEYLSEEERNKHMDFKGGGANVLTQERIGRLDAIGFDWNPAPPSVPWETRYQQLVEYKEKNGHTRVPRNWKENPQLGEFVHMQRRNYKLENQVLTEERKEKLNAIGFTWVAGADKLTFEDRLEECRNFRRAHGHLNVPRPLDPKKDDMSKISKEERAFRDWAQRQRDEYRRFNSGLKCRIDKGRIKKLTEMGFDWANERASMGRYVPRGVNGNWEDNFTKLKHVYELFGNVNDINNLKAAYPEDKYFLEWVKNQRKIWKKDQRRGEQSSVVAERNKLLEELEFDFAPRRHYAPYGSKKAERLAREAAESVSTGQSDE